MSTGPEDQSPVPRSAFLNAVCTPQGDRISERALSSGAGVHPPRGAAAFAGVQGGNGAGLTERRQ
jgi:hypothetical protein